MWISIPKTKFNLKFLVRYRNKFIIINSSASNRTGLSFKIINWAWLVSYVSWEPIKEMREQLAESRWCTHIHILTNARTDALQSGALRQPDSIGKSVLIEELTYNNPTTMTSPWWAPISLYPFYIAFQCCIH